MALKFLRLQRQQELLQARRAELVSKQEELQEAATGLEEALNEAETDEDLLLIDEKISAHATGEEALAEELAEVEAQLEELGEQLEEQRAKSEVTQVREAPQKREDARMTNVVSSARRVQNDWERRERMATALQDSSVRIFFENVQNLVLKRAVNDTELLIPETVINMIEIDMQDLGVVLGLVTRQNLQGTGRIVMAGDTPTAIWTEMCAEIPELSLSFNMMEVDGYKVSGFVPVCNAVLEDSFINLAVHVQQQLATSIARALDTAIVQGEGATSKQPEGIVPSLDASHKLTVAADWVNILRAFAKLPDDARSITAIMTRATYYTYFVEQTLTATADGRIVAQPAVESPRLPDGTPVRFVKKSVLEDGEMLLGDFSRYLLVQRAGLQLAYSEHQRFIQDQTLFRGTARYDGKTLKNEYWLHFTLTAPTGGN